MPYPGTLLTSQQHDLANRLFNVAVTRAQGKFILVSNSDFMRRKRLSPKLMFSDALKRVDRENHTIWGEQLFEQLGTREGDAPELFLGDRDEVDSWSRYIADISSCVNEICIDIPGPVDCDLDAYDDMNLALQSTESKGAKIIIRAENPELLPGFLQRYAVRTDFVSTPLTIIDLKTIWFGV